MVQQKTVRVMFEKTGKLQYISHLDLLRTMQTALRRAKVKMMYSEGFNPHMKINFALPLSIGIESVYEFMDLKTDADVDCNEVKVNLGKNLPENMKIIDVYEAETKLTDIKYAEYLITLDYGEKSEEAADMAKRLYCNPLVITKKTKKGEKEVDVLPQIKRVQTDFVDGKVVINCLLCAESENYLNPFYLTNALDKEVGEEALSRTVMRRGAYVDVENLFR